MNIKKSITLTLVLSSLMTISAFAFGIIQRPGIKELESNKEYMTLIERSSELSEAADSINELLAEYREMMNDDDAEQSVETLRAEIIALEQQSHDISVEQGNVTRRIGAIEQEHIMNQILSQQQHVVVGEIIDDSMPTIDEQSAVANLVENLCFKNELTQEDYANLLRAQTEEVDMLGFVNEYIATYEKLSKVATDYVAADRAAVADPLFKQYEELSAKLEALDEKMNTTWNHILDTKYFAMQYILEKLHRYDIIDNAANNYQRMEYKCASESGVYSSDALMRYSLGRPTLLRYELEFARDLRLKPAQDSIRGVLDKYVAPVFNFEPISVEYREFKDFAKVKIGRTNFYDESNPLPEVRVYDNGTIYRILLGTYRQKQAMTLFKGVQPMSVARDKDGQYCYYAGGYATETEARDDIQFLKDKGFKSPELCRWTDGVMTNIDKTKSSSSSKSTSQTSAKPQESKVQYMVVIRIASIDNKLRNIINSTAPGKSVSKSGSNFAVGLFKDRGEADMLVTSLSESYPTLEMSITEIKVE